MGHQDHCKNELLISFKNHVGRYANQTGMTQSLTGQLPKLFVKNSQTKPAANNHNQHAGFYRPNI